MPYELISDEPLADEKSYGSEALRHTSRTASRIGEQAAGFPGDILSLINDYIAGPSVSGFTGNEPIPYEELGISGFLPTSGQLRKKHEAAAGEYVKPQNKVEKFTDDLFSDATSLFLPGKKGTGILKSGGAALAKSVGANLAKEQVKDLTGDEKKGAYAHLGTLALLSFIDKPGAAKAISEGFKPLESRVTQLSPVSASKLESSLNNLKSKMMKGTQAPSEKFVIDEIDAVLSKIKGGKITPEEAWAAKRSLNEKLAKVLFEMPQKGTQVRARALATQISHELDDALKLTQKQDPKFYKDLKAWNKAYGTMAESNVVSRWVENNLKYSPVTAGLLHAFGSPIGTSTAGAIVPYQIGKVIYRMATSPKLAQHYAKTMALAGVQDARAFNKQLKILDQEIQKEEKKDRFILVD